MRGVARRAYFLYLALAAVAVRLGLTARMGRRGRALAQRADALLRRLFLGPPPESAVVGGITLRFPRGGHLGVELSAGAYEAPATDAVRRLLVPGATFVDVGAHVGYFSVLAAVELRRVGRGAVFAFEPDPVSRRFLEQNAEANGVRDAVEVVPMAVSDRTGTAVLHVWGGDRVTSSVFGGGGAAQERIECRMTSLDAFFAERGWPSVDLIKIDVEGAENLVLWGADELCRRNPQLRVIVEFSPSNLRRAGASAERLFATLAELGFARVALVDEPDRPLDLPSAVPELVGRVGAAHVNLLCERG